MKESKILDHTATNIELYNKYATGIIT